MIRYAAQADRLLDELHEYYDRKQWFDAGDALDRAMAEAERLIERSPGSGLPAPRPYPELAATGELWILVRHYWIAYTPTDPPVILAVFRDTANMPGRYRPTQRPAS